MPPNVGRSRPATASRSKCSCRAGPATNAAPVDTGAACATAWPTCTASSTSSKPPGLWGGYATHLYLAPDAMLLPVPSGLDAVRRDAVQPAGRRHPVGGDASRYAHGRRSSPCSARASAGLSACAAAKDAGADLVLVTGYGPRDAERLEVARAVRRGHHRRRCGRQPGEGAARRDRRTVGRRRRRRHGQGARRPRPSGRARARPAAPSCSRAPGARTTRQASRPITSSTRSCTSSARSASTPLPTQLRSTCSPRVGGPSMRCRGQCAGLDGVDELLRLLAGEVEGTPPVHAVAVP